MDLLFDDADELKQYLAEHGIDALAIKRLHPQSEKWAVLFAKTSQLRKVLKIMPRGQVEVYSQGAWHGNGEQPHFRPSNCWSCSCFFIRRAGISRGLAPMNQPRLRTEPDSILAVVATQIIPRSPIRQILTNPVLIQNSSFCRYPMRSGLDKNSPRAIPFPSTAIGVYASCLHE